MVRLVCFSDTHGKSKELIVPAGDFLICVGDVSNFGRKEELKKFFEWFQDHPHKYKIFLPGNHDRNRWVRFHKNRTQYYRDTYPSVRFWLHDYEEIEGIKFYGCFSMTAKYGQPINEDAPNKVDVLLTHSPPYRARDQVPLERVLKEDNLDVFRGDKLVRAYVQQVVPKIHIVGHIHEGHGVEKMLCGTTVYNVSCCDYEGNIAHQPTVIDYDI